MSFSLNGHDEVEAKKSIRYNSITKIFDTDGGEEVASFSSNHFEIFEGLVFFSVEKDKFYQISNLVLVMSPDGEQEFVGFAFEVQLDNNVKEFLTSREANKQLEKKKISDAQKKAYKELEEAMKNFPKNIPNNPYSPAPYVPYVPQAPTPNVPPQQPSIPGSGPIWIAPQDPIIKYSDKTSGTIVVSDSSSDIQITVQASPTEIKSV